MENEKEAQAQANRERSEARRERTRNVWARRNARWSKWKKENGK
jgi:hypothetical protein